jgi:hypothetical protein
MRTFRDFDSQFAETSAERAARLARKRKQGQAAQLMQEDTDEAKLWAAGKRILDLEAALDIVLADIGWRGSATDSEAYSCEYCKASHEDCALIEHHPGCKVTTLRRVRNGGKF